MDSKDLKDKSKKSEKSVEMKSSITGSLQRSIKTTRQYISSNGKKITWDEMLSFVLACKNKGQQMIPYYY